MTCYFSAFFCYFGEPFFGLHPNLLYQCFSQRNTTALRKDTELIREQIPFWVPSHSGKSRPLAHHSPSTSPRGFPDGASSSQEVCVCDSIFQGRKDSSTPSQWVPAPPDDQRAYHPTHGHWVDLNDVAGTEYAFPQLFSHQDWLVRSSPKLQNHRKRQNVCFKVH